MDIWISMDIQYMKEIQLTHRVMMIDEIYTGSQIEDPWTSNGQFTLFTLDHSR